MSTATQPEPNTRLAPAIESVLARLRRAIRAYVWVEGSALALAVLGIGFWLSLGFDWVFEPPAPLRVAILVAAGLALGWVIVRYILLRTFVQLADRSMAVLLERRFKQFHDSLLTTVELAESPDHAAEFNPDMLVHTQREALAGAATLPLGSVFNLRPLVRRALLALLLLASVVAFGVAAAPAFGIWVRRNLLLQDERWPRQTHLVVEGFTDGRVKIARGGDLDLIVKAEAAPGRLVPEVVEIRYLQGGSRGRENMSRSGSAVPGRDEFQNYNYTFKDVLAPIEFYIRGGDDRQGPYRLDVVDSPTVGQMVLHCEYPAYMHREPRDIPVAGAMQLPRGTRVTIEALANKDLVQVQIDDLVDEQTPVTHKIDLPVAQGASDKGPGDKAASSRSFQYVIDSLDADKTLRFTLLDTDGIRSRDPVRLGLSAAADEAPQVSVQLQGIGTAITARARLPLVGEITDDYGVAKAWFEVQVDDGEPRQQPFQATVDGQDRLTVGEAFEVEPLKLEPKQKLHLSVQAADTFALADKPNQGTSQRYVLDVVTPEQLRSLLEARELQLRRRLETLIQEMTENRDAVARIDFKTRPAAEEAKPGADAKPADQPAAGAEPGDEPSRPSAAADPESETDVARQAALRRVHAERALQNSQRSADETLGVAASFDTIREELINNRIDTEELKSRLKDEIADPLRRISVEMFPEFDRRLRLLESRLADPAAGQTAQSAAREQADAILVEMTAVLDKMLELETFNEVVDILRAIIESQQHLNDQTKEKQKDKLKNLLDDE